MLLAGTRLDGGLPMMSLMFFEFSLANWLTRLLSGFVVVGRGVVVGGACVGTVMPNWAKKLSTPSIASPNALPAITLSFVSFSIWL